MTLRVEPWRVPTRSGDPEGSRKQSQLPTWLWPRGDLLLTSLTPRMRASPPPSLKSSLLEFEAGSGLASRLFMTWSSSALVSALVCIGTNLNWALRVAAGLSLRERAGGSWVAIASNRVGGGGHYSGLGASPSARMFAQQEETRRVDSSPA